MPRIKSAIKRVQVTERNRQRNMAYKSAIRTAMKKVLGAAATTADAKTLEESFKRATGVIDRAILKGVLHKNTGARYKSRLARAFQKAKAA